MHNKTRLNYEHFNVPRTSLSWNLIKIYEYNLCLAVFNNCNFGKINNLNKMLRLNVAQSVMYCSA